MVSKPQWQLEAEHKLLRLAVTATIEMIARHDIGHAVVDSKNPQVGLTKYLQRTLEDTRPIKE